MNKGSTLIRHEILNIFTLLNFEVTDTDLPDITKERFLKNIKMLTLLVSYEDIFLGKKRKNFYNVVDLSEIIETIILIHHSEINRKQIKIIDPGNKLMIKVDRTLIQEAIDQIFVKIIDTAKEIAISYKNGALKITHNASDPLLTEKFDLIKSISNREPCKKFPYQLALHLLEINGAKVLSEKSLLTITFK